MLELIYQFAPTIVLGVVTLFDLLHGYYWLALLQFCVLLGVGILNLKQLKLRRRNAVRRAFWKDLHD